MKSRKQWTRDQRRYERQGKSVSDRRLNEFCAASLKSTAYGMKVSPRFFYPCSDLLRVLYEDDVIAKEIESCLKAKTWKRVHHNCEVGRGHEISAGDVVTKSTDVQIEKTAWAGKKKRPCAGAVKSGEKKSSMIYLVDVAILALYRIWLVRREGSRMSWRLRSESDVFQLRKVRVGDTCGKLITEELQPHEVESHIQPVENLWKQANLWECT